MKTNLVRLFLLAGALLTCVQLSIAQQTDTLQIEPHFVDLCVGECANFIIVDENGEIIVPPTPPNFWEIIWFDPNGQTFTTQEPFAEFCFFEPGVYEINALIADSLQNTVIFPSTVFVEDFNFPEITSFSNTFCPSDSIFNNPDSGCQTVCANSLVTYTVEQNPGVPSTNLQWTVSGANNFWISSPIPNTITVEWGDPGTGFLAVETFGFCQGFNQVCVEIISDPQAEIATNPPAMNDVVEVCRDQTLYFENNSTGAESYLWDFGGLGLSTEVNPEFSFPSPGTYEVTLIARNECYCSDTTNITVEVLDGEAPQIDCIGTICADEIVTYTSPNACGEYYWNIIGNGVIVEGGATTDDYITVQWLDGPEGFIELRVEGCGGTECNQTTIERVPILTDGAPINGPEKVCVDDYATYTIPKYDGTEYTWSINGGGTIESGQGTNSIVVHWFGWFSEPVVRVDYESCYLGCGGFSELEVLIRNEFYISGPIEACENTSTTHNIELFFGAPADTWDWAVTDETGATVWTSPTAGDQTTVDWTFGPGLYTLSATANTPDNFCNDSYSTRIRVPESPPKPIDISGQTDICPGEPYTYEASSSIANDEYQWQIQDGSNTVIVEGNPIVYSWGASPPYVIAVAQIANSGPLCLSDTLQMDVQALTPPVIEPVADVCKEDIVIYQLSSFYPEETYDWTITPSTAGSIISGQGESTVEVLWHQTGVHTITAGLCNLDDSEAVTVHPTPEPEVNHPDGLCQGETEMVSTILTYSSYEWRDEGGAVLSTDPQPLLEPGTYELVVTNQFGCAGNTSFTIDSYDLPSVFISSPDDLGYCTGDPAAVLFASATGDGYTYQWFYNGNPVSTNPGLTAPGFGFYQVEVIDVNGCTALSNVLEIFENCDPVGGICNGNSTGFPQDCPEGTSIQFNIEPATDCAISTFTNVSPDFVPGTLEWYFDDGTTSLDQGPVVQHTYSQAGYYVVILTGISQSTGLFCYNTKLNIVPAVAAFDYEIACPNAPMQFRDYSTHVPTEDITGWDWDFGDPASGPNNFSTDQHPTHEFSVSGIFDVTLTVTSTTGCTNTITRQVEVAPIPTVDFPLPAPGCEGNAMDFEAVVDADVVEVEWDFDDPSTADANTSNLNSSFHIFSGPGSYDVTLLATNVFGCQNSITKTVTIEPNLLSGVITPSGPLTVCEGDGIFLNAEDPSQAAGTTFEWSTGEVGSEIFIDTENTYSVTVTDPQGCRYVPDPVTLDVVPDPNGSIYAVEYNEFGQAVANQYNGLSICEGEDVYLEITQAPGYTYQWSTGEFGTEIVFADWRGNPLPVGIHDFTVTITDTNTGCSNEVGPFIVTVNENPDPISITPDGILCENTLLNLTVNNPDPGLTYIWNTGETGTSIQVFTAGAYFVRGINASGCSTESNTLTVNPAPDLSSIPSGCLTRCDPDTICLPNIPFVDTYQWYLDGNPVPAPEGTDPDFIATESGTYFVELTDVFGCATISNDLDLELYTGYGSLLGNVYFDVNQNGIIDGPDTLMPGINIILLQNNIPQDTSTSNGQGSWAFPGILSVDYQLAVDTANLEPGFEALIVSENISLVGCDDLETVDWLITGGCIQQTASLELGACTGETVNYNGQDLSIGSNTDFTLQTIDGCDSIVSVSVTELLPTAETFELQACEGTTIFYNGDPIPAGQQADFVLTNAAGCDSLLTVVVEAVSEYAIDVDLETCNGVPVMFDGTELTPGTITDFNYISSQGCDSTVTVEVIEFPKDSMGLQFQSCSGVEVPYNGMNLAPGTVTEFVFSNSNGCDSIVTVEVAELLPSSATEIFSACTGETVSYAGTNLNPGTVTEFVFTNAAGCDSTVTVTVDELVPTSDFIQLAACTGTTVDYNGNSLAPGTVTEFQFTNSVGCDSTVEVTVEELFGSIETLNLEACSGETVVYNNDVLNAGTTTTYTFQNADGCDSIVIVDVEELAVSFETLNLSACDGNTVFYNGMPLMPGSSTDFVFANTAGCDSTVTVNVIANQSSFTDLTFDICPGEWLEYENTILQGGEQLEFLFQNAAGCDSTVTVTVNEYPGTTFDYYAEESCTNTLSGAIYVENVQGPGPHQFALDGGTFQSDPFFENLNTGVYSLEVIDANGCIYEQPVEVTAIPEVDLNVISNALPCDGEGATITTELLSGNPLSISYLWPDGSTDWKWFTDQPGIYQVSVDNGCETVVRSFSVSYEEDGKVSYLYIPNAFSPNFDGVNDYFRAFAADGINIIDYHLEVYDRWGDRVFVAEAIDQGWDGIHLEEDMNAAVFVYFVEATIESCGQVQQIFRKGDVIVVR